MGKGSCQAEAWDPPGILNVSWCRGWCLELATQPICGVPQVEGQKWHGPGSLVLHCFPPPSHSSCCSPCEREGLVNGIFLSVRSTSCAVMKGGYGQAGTASLRSARPHWGKSCSLPPPFSWNPSLSLRWVGLRPLVWHFCEGQPQLCGEGWSVYGQ